MAIPGLQRGVRSRVYERVVQQLRTDPVLSKIFPPNRWVAGFANPDLKIATAGNEPLLILTPRMSSQTWYKPDAQKGTLEIQVQYWLRGNNNGQYDALDVMDVWEAFERALYSPDKAKRQACKLELQHLGCTTGEFLISQPASTFEAGGEAVANVGSIQIEIARNIN